jgi:hypothetical protein
VTQKMLRPFDVRTLGINLVVTCRTVVSDSDITIICIALGNLALDPSYAYQIWVILREIFCLLD